MKSNSVFWKDNPLLFAQTRIDSRQYIALPRIGEILNDEKIESILDYGCGEGFLLDNLTDKDIQIDMYDIAGEMVQLAGQNASKLGFTKACVFSQKEDVKQNSYDAVVLSLVLMTLGNDKEYQEALADCYNSLRPNGLLIICITHPCFRPALFSTYHTEYTLGTELNYFQNHTAFEVYLRTNTSDMIKFFDFHQPLSYTINQLIKIGFVIKQFEELTDAAIQHSYYNKIASPYIIIQCTKP